MDFESCVPEEGLWSPWWGRGLLSGGGAGPAPFSKRETLRCLCPSLRKGMEGVPESICLWHWERDRPNPTEPTFSLLCVCPTCVCMYTC